MFRVDMPGGFFKAANRTVSSHFSSRNLLIITLVGVGYFVTGELGVMLAAPHPATPVWLPAGLSLAAILLAGKQVWPGIFVGAMGINMLAGMHFWSFVGIAMGNTLSALLAAYLVNRFAHGTYAFFKPRNLLRFVFYAGILSTAMSALLGAFVICATTSFAGWSDFAGICFLWWTGDLLGVVLMTPFLVLLLGHKHHALESVELLEFTFLLVGLSVVCVLNFGPAAGSRIPGSGLHYLCIPFLAWAAVRFCPLEAAGATLVLGSFAMWGSLHGYGLFAKSDGAPFVGAGYVAVACVTTLTIAAVFREQKENLEDALGAYYALKEDIERGTAEMRGSDSKAATTGSG